MPQDQPLNRYAVELQHMDTKKTITYGALATSPDEAVKVARQQVSLLFREWMLSRMWVQGVRLVGVALVLLALASCTSSTGGSGAPSLTCEQQFDRALEQGVPYTEALGRYTQCLIDRDGPVNASITNRAY